jgi:hypothetical protein
MQGEHGDFLVIQAIARNFTTSAVEDEIVGAIPVFNDV